MSARPAVAPLASHEWLTYNAGNMDEKHLEFYGGLVLLIVVVGVVVIGVSDVLSWFAAHKWVAIVIPALVIIGPFAYFGRSRIARLVKRLFRSTSTRHE